MPDPSSISFSSLLDEARNFPLRDPNRSPSALSPNAAFRFAQSRTQVHLTLPRDSQGPNPLPSGFEELDSLPLHVQLQITPP